VMTDDGTDLHRLTPINPETEDPQAPAWSPDGRSIAVSSGTYCDPYGPCRRTDIWVVDANSGRRISTIPYGKGPSWSPDGKRLAFLGGRSEGEARSRVPYGIFVADAHGKHRRYLARGELPTWSPRSELIAYAAISRSGRFLGLHFVRANNGRIRPVASSQPAFAWSPNGTRMAFIEPFLLPRRLAVIDVPGSRTHTIGRAYIAFPRTVAWSPNGAMVAWVLYDRQRREQRLLVAAADASGSPRLLARVPRGHVLTTPVFSSDGRQVLYTIS
jgi:Tol biopolymer transport system component